MDVELRYQQLLVKLKPNRRPHLQTLILGSMAFCKKGRYLIVPLIEAFKLELQMIETHTILLNMLSNTKINTTPLDSFVQQKARQKVRHNEMERERERQTDMQRERERERERERDRDL